MAEKLPRQAAVELGFGVSSAQVNSEAYLAFEQSVAEAAPGGVAVGGSSPRAPGALAQTAPPDNAEPVHAGLSLPETPLDSLITGGALRGQVHAQWDDVLGPCVGTVSDASTEVGSLSLVNAIPTLPDVGDLTGVFDAPGLDAGADRAIIDGIRRLAGPLSTLGGVLSGDGAPRADGRGSLVSLPNTLATRSIVQLVDLPGSPNKAVRSTSTLRVAAIELLAGTPFALELRVVSQPTLQVTATGNARTSSVEYTAPVIEVWQGGRQLGRLDAADPNLDVPIGIPLPDVPGAEKLPVIGGLLANGQRVDDAVRTLDLGVLRLGVARLDEKRAAMTDPFEGFQLGATARMLDVQVLLTEALGLPNLPSALVQVSLGEQIARAYAPTGGVVCRTSDQPQPPPDPEPQGRAPRELAYTTLAYKTVPMFWAGTAMLLIGVVLVAAVPMSRPARGAAGASGGGDPAGADEIEGDAPDTGTNADADANTKPEPKADTHPEAGAEGDVAAESDAGADPE
ncbi:hypothetical protein [Actinophytocola gossypii]|uniref:Uncharacterized protein n=1 Tax=Actinophytocola gossypii TaxID=2812003 RepID=A0ABT2J426_9PSEU|nr:hypothetical protein [Actinophytocola gossypii]MCT2582511.1 hypothetical protein [Actinophytocola gossypii]